MKCARPDDTLVYTVNVHLLHPARDGAGRHVRKSMQVLKLAVTLQGQYSAQVGIPGVL